MNTNTTILNLLKTNGFTQVPNKDWPNTVGDKLKDAVDSVWGLQMRANKWADVFVISLDDGDWKIINDDQIKNIGANRIEKEITALMSEEYGAGFEGTNELRDKYIKDTPGQRIQQFKTKMKQKTYQEFEAQHKKMYPSHNMDQIKAAYKKYSEYSEIYEAINIRDYMATSEKSQFGGYRPKVVNKSGKVLYLGQASYNTPFEAKDHAEEYLKQYARGISEPRVPSKGSYDLKEEKESYDSWIIKPRDGGESVKIKAPDETSAIEIALGRKPSQHELDFFNFHYILIQEKTNVSTLRHMKIVELATNCHDEKTLKEYVEQQYKSGSSVLNIKESFKKFVSNK